MVEHSKVTRLHLVAHEVAHLVVADRIPTRTTIALKILDRVDVGFTLEKPETRHERSVAARCVLYTTRMPDLRVRCVGLMLLRVLAITSCLAGFAIETNVFAAPPAQGDRRELARREAEERLRTAMLPSPMSRERFTSMVSTIDPALVEHTDLADAFANYTAQAAALRDTTAERVTGRLAAAFTFEAGRETFVPRPNPELVEAFAVRNKWAAQLTALERALFRSLALAAPPERRVNIAEARVAWIDERTEREPLLSSTRLTLVEIVGRARLDAETLRILEPILATHLERLVLLRESRDEALRDGDLARARIETEAGTLWRSGTQPSVDATHARLHEVDAGELRTEFAIRDLHFASLRRIRAQLPPDAGRRVIEEWQRSVHPELFDDERMVAVLVRSLLAIPERDPEGDEVLLELVDAAYRRLEPLGRDAAVAADAILPMTSTHGAIQPIEERIAEIDARLRLIDLQARRRTVLRELVMRVRGGVPAEAAEARTQVARLADSLVALDRADMFDRESLRTLAQTLQDAMRAEAEAEAEAETARDQPNPAGKDEKTLGTNPAQSPRF